MQLHDDAQESNTSGWVHESSDRCLREEHRAEPLRILHVSHRNGTHREHSYYHTEFLVLVFVELGQFGQGDKKVLVHVLLHVDLMQVILR